MICVRCGTVFCWDEADTLLLGCIPKRFCSTSCQKKGARGKVRQPGPVQPLQPTPEIPRPPCPTPWKLVFPEPGDAFGKALRDSRRFGRPYRAYECECGDWHLTMKRALEDAS